MPEYPSREDLVVVLWALVSNMTATQLLTAIDELETLPVAKNIQPLIEVFREELTYEIRRLSDG